MPRMNILNTLEQEEFDLPPVFNSLARKKFFDFPSGILAITENLRTQTNKVCFLAIAGYFKARGRFFSLQFHPTDIDYLAHRCGVFPEFVEASSYDKQTYGRHRHLILEYYGVREFDQAAEQMVRQEIASMVVIHVKPKQIFYAMVDFLSQHRIEIPGYALLSSLILDQTRHYKHQLVDLIEHHLSAAGKVRLDELLEKDMPSLPDHPSPQGHRSRLTRFKKFSQSTKPSKIKASVEDWHRLSRLYREFESVIGVLALPLEGVRYYAGSVIRSEVFKIARRADDDRYLHWLALIAHQYFGLQDTLIDVLLKVTQSFANSTRREYQEQYYEERQQRSHLMRQLVHLVDDNLLGTLTAIQSITDSESLADTEKIQQIKEVLALTTPQQHSIQAQVDPLKKEIETKLRDEDFYRIVEIRSVKLQNKIRPILKAIRFQATASSTKLMTAIEYYQRQQGVIEKTAPITFLTLQEQKLVWGKDGKFKVSLYKALLMLQIADAIKSGTLNLTHSYTYRPLADYLMAPQDWEDHRATYLHTAGLEALSDSSAHLNYLRQTLDEQYHRTNQNIRTQTNRYVKFSSNGTFTLSTPKLEERESHSLSRYFPEKESISLLEILSTVNRATGFLDEFEHWQVQYHRAKPHQRVFFAAIMGEGCDIGTHKIAKISKHVRESEIDNTVNWFFTANGIHNAIDRILQMIDHLELPKVYRRELNRLHTSSDGQKFEMEADSLNAGHSFKYFGTGKGVSVYSFIDERHLLFHSTVISAAERESAYVIDGLLQNNVVTSDLHSTDTHGVSEVIFATMHLLGFSFAPRIKGIKHQHRYAFVSKRQYAEKGYSLLPDGSINTALIEENWDDMLRFAATIKLKVATASDIFRRLNSYSKQHPVYRALKEFGKIPKTQHILTWVDDVVHRQTVEKQLNKIESSHKLSNAVTLGNPRQFSQSEKHAQEIAEACKRLIKNAIICWNYLYLSQKIAEETDTQRRTELIEAVRLGSVVCWQHINLLGEYDFSEEKLQDSIGFELPKILNLKLPDLGGIK